MESLVDVIVQSQTIHGRAYAIEAFMRWMEHQIDTEQNNNSDETKAQVQRLIEYHFNHHLAFQKETLLVHRTLISTGMLLFSLTSRCELHMYEPSWRETNSHLRLGDIAQPWIDRDFIEEDPEPILFMCCSKIFRLLQRLQGRWYQEEFEDDILTMMLKWLERRLSLLMTFPFDIDTFDLSQYRQKHGKGTFLGNTALVYDAYAYITCMMSDLRHYQRLEFALEEVEDEDPTKANTVMRSIMENTQGDSLCIDYQKQFVQGEVRIADALIFARRRTEVLAPTAMEIITECNGIERANQVHSAADVQLKEVYLKPEVHLQIWMIVLNYYFSQKHSFSWQAACTQTRFHQKGKKIFPLILQVPILNRFGVQKQQHGKIHLCSSFLQAVLYWIRTVLDQTDGMLKFENKHFFLKDTMEEFVTVR